jgi:hypothetical protein
MDRLQQKHDMYVKLGMLFGPFKRIVEHPEQYDEQERAETQARYIAESKTLQVEFHNFCRSMPGQVYEGESSKFFKALYAVRRRIERGEPLEKIVREQLKIAQEAIDAVPIPRTSVILEAGSPFTAYCKLRELCEADATKSLLWLDPFVDISIFHRYLANARPPVPVVLVTSEPGPHASNRDRTRWNEFLDVSRLFAQERGVALYRLVVQPNLHDRWVVFDNKRIYALGGSAKDAAARDYFTITSVEASPENLRRIQDHLTTGSEYFGPSAPMHQ